MDDKKTLFSEQKEDKKSSLFSNNDEKSLGGIFSKFTTLIPINNQATKLDIKFGKA